MKNIIIAMLLISMAGCAQLARDEITIGCQAADAVTTVAALEAGASEANPIVAKIIASSGYLGLVVFKVVIAAILMHYSDDAPEAVGAANAITCGAALNNALLL